MQMIYWAQKMTASKYKHFAAKPCTFLHSHDIQWHNSHHFMFLLFSPQFCKTLVSNIF